MKILVDVQCLGTGSGIRGIGRYTRGLLYGLSKRNDIELSILINIANKNSSQIYREYVDLLGKDNIVKFCPLGDYNFSNYGEVEYEDSEELYCSAVIDSGADCLIVASIFEGNANDSYILPPLEKLKGKVLTACVVYDFIPYVDSNKYLSSIENRYWYKTSLGKLFCCDLLLGISDYTKSQCESIINAVPCEAIYGSSDFFKKEIEKEESFNNISEIRSPFVLYVGGIDERKNMKSLIAAWGMAPDSIIKKYQLVIVAGGYDPSKTTALRNKVKECRINNIIIIDRVSDTELKKLYSSCHLFVFPSLSEGFGLPIIEAMKNGAPVICSNATACPEVVSMKDATFDPFDHQAILSKIVLALENEHFRSKLLENSGIRSQMYTWDRTAELAIEALRERRTCGVGNYSLYSSLQIRRRSEENRKKLAIAIANQTTNTIWFDITSFHCSTIHSGIQRVVGNFLKYIPELIKEDKEIICIRAKDGYYEAIENRDSKWEVIGRVSPKLGDIYLCIDLVAPETLRNKNTLIDWQSRGCSLIFCVYDLVFEKYPQFVTSKAAVEVLDQWLRFVLLNADGIVTDSKSVLDELQDFSIANGLQRKHQKYGYFYNGCDFKRNLITNKKHIGYKFITVSTIEPRKGYDYLIESFRKALELGMDAELIIVGRRGWKCDQTVKLIRSCPKVVWYDNCEDDKLKSLYEEADCFVFASQYEGFGIAVIEAASYGLPLLLRDIPVFREVAGDNAVYFNSDRNNDLTDRLIDYVSGQKKQPDSSKIRGLTWRESTRMMLDAVEEMIR